MVQSPSEEVCKRRFDAFLGQVSPAQKRCWHDVDPVAEPPDYYLELDEARYAVEITTLTSELQLGSRSVPQVGAVEALRGFVKAIEDRARRDHLLRGSYVVAFRRPIDDFHMLRQGIADSLLDYIRETSDLCSAPEEVVFRRGRQRCSIQKYHTAPDSVAAAGPTLGKWEGETDDEVCDLLAERLCDKAHKLRNVAEPKILLLHDRYLFADQAQYQACVATLPFLECFHTIFVARGSGGSFVLHSENSAWRATS